MLTAFAFVFAFAFAFEREWISRAQPVQPIGRPFPSSVCPESLSSITKVCTPKVEQVEVEQVALFEDEKRREALFVLFGALMQL